jgi:hypothetical protein
MQILKAVFGLLVAAFVILVAAFVVLANSSHEMMYECSGVTRTPGTNKSEQTTLFLKIIRYRSWLSSGDSDGMLHYEIPNTRSGVFSRMKSAGDYLNVYSFEFLQGQFSTVSNSLTLTLTDETIFYGICNRAGIG